MLDQFSGCLLRAKSRSSACASARCGASASQNMFVAIAGSIRFLPRAHMSGAPLRAFSGFHVDQQGGVCVGASAVAAREQFGKVARFPDRSVGALRVEIDRALALQGDVRLRAFRDELQIA